jgi:hypothetical protein
VAMAGLSPADIARSHSIDAVTLFKHSGGAGKGDFRRP